MSYSITPITEKDRNYIIDIYNHYIEHSFAAYLEERVNYDTFDRFMQMSEGYPRASVKNNNGKLIGFGFLRQYHFAPAFSKTAEISYFIQPEFTGKGIGKDLLDYLLEESKKSGLKHILASISSLNIWSISFHRKNGFKECGRFRNIGIKKGRNFDTIWMQIVL